VRADIVIVLPPFLDDVPSVSEASEDLLVQAFVTYFSVHTFRVAVFGRLARCNVMPFNLVILGPLQNGSTGKLRSIVTDDTVRLAALFDERVELTCNAHTSDRGIRNEGKALPAALIHDAQNTEATPIREGIAQEVE